MRKKKFLSVLLAALLTAGNVVAQAVTYDSIEAFARSRMGRGFGNFDISPVDEQKILDLINGVCTNNNRVVHIHHILSERPICMTEIRFANRAALVELGLLHIASVQSDFAERHVFLNPNELASARQLLARVESIALLRNSKLEVFFMASADHADGREAYLWVGAFSGEKYGAAIELENLLNNAEQRGQARFTTRNEETPSPHRPQPVDVHATFEEADRIFDNFALPSILAF